MPRVEVTERTLYQFGELSEDAQAAAVDAVRERAAHEPFPWAVEWRESLDAFERLAPIDVQDWGYGGSHGDHIRVMTTLDDDVAELSGVRAWKWLTNNGPDARSWFEAARANADGDYWPTGFCGDCPLFDPIAELARTPLAVPALGELFETCCDRWLRAAAEECDWYGSEEHAREEIEQNEIEFTEEGALA